MPMAQRPDRSPIKMVLLEKDEMQQIIPATDKKRIAAAIEDGWVIAPDDRQPQEPKGRAAHAKK